MDDDMVQKKQIKQQASEWFVELTSEEGVSARESRYAEWRAADPRHDNACKRMEVLAGYLGAMDLKPVTKSPNVSTRNTALHRGSLAGRLFSKWYVAGGLAVAACLLIIVWYAGIFDQLWPGAGVEKYQTETTEIRTFTLADGSVVTMGAKSAIAVSLSSQKRHVTLKAGDAFFDVAKDAERPFYVTAGDTIVSVSGTQFEVKRSANNIHVGVAEGVVQVGKLVSANDSTGTGANMKRLTKGLIAISDDKGIVVRNAAVPALVGAWRNGRLIYENETLGKIVADINRYYGKKIRIISPETADLRVTVTFDRKQVDQVLFNITLGLPVELDRSIDGTVLLKGTTTKK